MLLCCIMVKFPSKRSSPIFKTVHYSEIFIPYQGRSFKLFLPSGDEAVCRTHLQSFSQLAEIGFPSKDVHEALIQHSFDHQKALDQLIT